MNESAIDRRWQVAHQLSVVAGKQTLTRFQNRDLAVDRKGDDTPVTEADRDAEKLLREEIGRQFPEDGIVGEEFGETRGQNDIRWILDPIDGTNSFIAGVPLFGTMVGVEMGGRPEIGAVYIPGLNEGVFAATGRGAWHVVDSSEPVQAHVDGESDFARCIAVTSDIGAFETRGAGDACRQIFDQVDFFRTWGDCYGYLLVATGRVHLMIDPILSIWDAAAVAPIIREAGGIFCDWAGEGRIDAGEAWATTPSFFDRVLAITAPFAGKFST